MLRVATPSAIKMFRNSLKMEIMAAIGNLREDLVLTKHSESQNRHLKHGGRLAAYTLLRAGA